jgi:integrase
MSQQLTDRLKALLVERKKDALRYGWGEVPPWIFLSEEGTMIHESNFRYRVWYKLLEKVGLHHIPVHDLRH